MQRGLGCYPKKHMSDLTLIQKQLKASQARSEAQMAYLRHTAYRGVNTTAHQSPVTAYKAPVTSSLVYRGIPYSH